MGHQVVGTTHTWFILLLTSKEAKNVALKIKPKIMIYKERLKAMPVECSNTLCLEISGVS